VAIAEQYGGRHLPLDGRASSELTRTDAPVVVQDMIRPALGGRAAVPTSSAL
jgi:hypothetical protein